MTLYGDAIRALRQVILLDERVRNTSSDVARLIDEIVELRDRVSRIEGMLAVGMVPALGSDPPRSKRRLTRPADQSG